MFPAPVGIGFQPSPGTGTPGVGMETLVSLLSLPSCERNLPAPVTSDCLMHPKNSLCIDKGGRRTDSRAASATNLAAKNKPRTKSLAKHRAELGKKTTRRCSPIKIKNENLKPLLVGDPRLLTASPEGSARLQYLARNGTGGRTLLLLALGYRSAVHAPQINGWAGCVSSQFTCYRNNAGLEPELTQLRFGMQLVLREGGWQSLVRLYLPLEANLIYSSIHLLHSSFPALVGHSPTPLHKVLLLEQID